MIQRIQSLLMLLAALSILVINFKFPILELNEKKLLMQHFIYAQIALFTSAFLVVSQEGVLQMAEAAAPAAAAAAAASVSMSFEL